MADTTIDLLKNSSYVGKMDELIAAVKLGGSATSDVEWNNVKNKPTTIGGYGITDAKIDNGTITLGNQTITPLTSAPVTSVNNKTGAVTLSAADVSAIPSTLTGTAGQVLTKTADGQEWKDVEIPTALPNPNALTFTGAVTGSYDGSAPLEINIPSGGGSGGSGGVSTVNGIGPDANGNVYAESNYKEMVTLVSDTLTEETAGLKLYEYDIDGLELNDLLLLHIIFPNSYSAIITITNQSGHKLTDEFPNNAKGMLVGLKMMNGRYLHAASYQSNLAARVDLPLSLFFGQLNGASGFERPKVYGAITRLCITFSKALESGTVIKIMRM